VVPNRAKKIKATIYARDRLKADNTGEFGSWVMIYVQDPLPPRNIKHQAGRTSESTVIFPKAASR